MVDHVSTVFSPRRAGLVAALVVAAALGCDRVPLTAPSGATITLLPGANSMTPDGAMDITAIVIEGSQGTTGNNNNTSRPGTPVHNGTVVNFTTTLGSIEPAEATTTSGRATVRLVADGRSGTAVVTAYSGAAIETLEVTIASSGGSTAGR